MAGNPKGNRTETIKGGSLEECIRNMYAAGYTEEQIAVNLDMKLDEIMRILM